MTGDDLRALFAEAVMDVDGEQQYGVVITRKQRDALADLIDAAQLIVSWCHHNDDGEPWNLIMQMGEKLDALAAVDALKADR